MKLVIYDAAYNIVDKVGNIKSPIVEGNSINWEDGSMSGITLPFILLDDSIEVMETVNDELIQMDRKGEFPSHNLIKENEDLKVRLESAEAAIITLMDFL